jgi:hypothetical protein
VNPNPDEPKPNIFRFFSDLVVESLIDFQGKVTNIVKAICFWFPPVNDFIGYLKNYRNRMKAHPSRTMLGRLAACFRIEPPTV